MLPATVRDEFIGLLMETGNVSRAARTLGINRMTAYGWRDDPEFAGRWDAALDVARQGLRERVVETACAMGLARMVPLVDDLGDPVLDEEFERVLVADTSHVDARVLMKLMDKTMSSEDGAPVTAVAIQNNLTVHAPRERPELVDEPEDLSTLLADASAEDADFEEIADDDE